VKRRGALAKAAVVTFAVTALAPLPAARADGVDSGDVHLKLSAALVKALDREGVRLIGQKGAKAGKAGATLPISNGSLESTFGNGYLFLEGGLKFRAGKRAVRLRNIVLNMSEHALRARVNGKTMKLAELAPQRPSIDGFGLDLAIKSMKLTGRAASRLGGSLGLHRIFRAGGLLGSASAMAHFESLTIHSGEITLTLDEAFREKLASLETDIGVSGSAKMVGAAPTAISMLLESGQIAPDASTGVLISQGGLVLSQPDEPFDHTIAFLYTTVALDSHVVSGDANYQPNPRQLPLSGPIGTLPTPVAAQANPDSGEISASSLPITLHSNFVPVLNEILGAPKGHPDLFAVGEPIGTVAFRVQTR
jgi:hypothetical protein